MVAECMLPTSHVVVVDKPGAKVRGHECMVKETTVLFAPGEVRDWLRPHALLGLDERMGEPGVPRVEECGDAAVPLGTRMRAVEPPRVFRFCAIKPSELSAGEFAAKWNHAPVGQKRARFVEVSRKDSRCGGRSAQHVCEHATMLDLSSAIARTVRNMCADHIQFKVLDDDACARKQVGKVCIPRPFHRGNNAGHTA